MTGSKTGNPDVDDKEMFYVMLEARTHKGTITFGATKTGARRMVRFLRDEWKFDDRIVHLRSIKRED